MPSPSAADFVAAARAAIDRVSGSQADQVARAAELIADALAADGIVQAFGTGHSEAFAMELAGRAGGLVPSNRIALRDVVLFGGRPVEVLDGSELERGTESAALLWELTAPHPADVFVLASNSGVNGCVVELARLAKENGHPLIVVTSAEHTAGVRPKHPSGLRLRDYADVVLDNGAPFGDAVLPMAGGGRACGISSITAALLGQQIIAEVIRRVEENGGVPPVYLSANIPGGDEHNNALEARYAGRIRRTA
ncbi:sugar isomerase domain-containing protein [Kitasatospora sp. CB01950]|uniref:sugar isomerase domain-containing protein n=1 Tax=Kitasatospora sp. CB01950 TaxID=1703930 RepID=UPI00093C00FE|nr:SIS domain-containing protein [Kitasatospora sp. CB01950]OKJ17087.1 sugar isomerase [Kitasatospora sp. CB01950]